MEVKITQDLVGQIMDFEAGIMKPKEAVKLFQHLIDTGMAWKLQGSYGRIAENLINNGLCHMPKQQ